MMFRFTHHTRKDVCEVPGGVVAYRSCIIDNRPERRVQLVDLSNEFIVQPMSIFKDIGMCCYANCLAGPFHADNNLNKNFVNK